MVDVPAAGFHGKILTVDLSTGQSRIDAPGTTFWRLHAGGGLLAARLMLDRTEPGLDPFNPAARLILTSSIAAGHPWPGLMRFSLSCKSPLTGGIAETRSEGPFAEALKASGFEAIVLEGAAPEASVLIIANGTVQIIPAGDLWGQGTARTDAALVAEHGEAAGRLVIGPAGENLVRFAAVVANRDHMVARMGVGAVMGSKRLKAVVLKDGQLPPVARPAARDGWVARYRDAMAGNDLTHFQHEPPGFAAWVHLLGEEASLCTRNFRDSVFEGARGYDPGVFMARFRGAATCAGCPNDCIKRFDGAGETGDMAAWGTHQEVTGALGPNIGIPDAGTVLDLNAMCMDLGLDPVSLGFTLSFAMDCAEEGLAGFGTAEGPLKFGAVGPVRAAIRAIARREGDGALLAEGSARAAAWLGGGAARLALHVKGLEMVPFEPRAQTNLGLGFATAPIGPRYDICEHDWDFDPSVGWSHTLERTRTLGIHHRVPMQALSPDKVRNFKALNTLWSAADALGLCIFAIAPTRILTIDEMARIISDITGFDLSTYEMMQIGERRNAVMRLYNLREGLGPEQDTLPDRFFDEPIRQGRWAGQRLDRAAFARSVSSYYQMSGYDRRGVPLPDLLFDLNLGDLVPLAEGLIRG